MVVCGAVLGALEANAEHHWNPAVHGLTLNVRKMFQDMDDALYTECKRAHDAEQVRFPGDLQPRLVTVRERGAHAVSFAY